MHGNLKNVPKFSLSHISQSLWWNCGSITVMNFLRYHNYGTQLFRKLFLNKWVIILIGINIEFIKISWFATSRFGTSLVNFGFIIYQKQTIHVIIGWKHDVSGIVGSETIRGHSDTLRASCIDWSSWHLRASDLTMHDTSCLNPWTTASNLCVSVIDTTSQTLKYVARINSF